MPMQAHFKKRLAEARLRWDLDRLLRHVADAALAAAGVGLAAVAVERSFGVHLVFAQSVGVFLAVVAAATAVRWRLTRPSLMQVALALDERIALRERFSTTLALAKSEDPWAQAAREETYQRAERLDVGRYFAVRPTWRWAHAGGVWAGVALAAIFMPQLDLLGHKAALDKLAREKQATAQAKAEVAQAVATVEALAKPLNDPALMAELAKLQTFDAQANPQEIRRQSIKALGDVAKRVEEMRQGDQAQTAQALQEMMRQMHAPGQGLSKDLEQALAKGKFDKAAELAKQLGEKLSKGDLSDKDRAALAKELADLAKQLEKMAEDRKALEDALSNYGLDKSLAGLSEKELREALEKAGLSQEAIDKLLEKAKACQNAGRLCKALGKCIGQCAGSMGVPGNPTGDLAMLSDELANLAALGDKLGVLDAMMADLEGQMAALGMDPSLMGMGGKSPWEPGFAENTGAGTGGPGHGYGPNDVGPPSQTGNQKTRVANQQKSGPIIATWFSKEEQVKGEATRVGGDAVQAAKDAAAEAVNENRIPSLYHESVKSYFDNLGKGDPPTGGKP
jgi:hypothetical protein